MLPLLRPVLLSYSRSPSPSLLSFFSPRPLFATTTFSPSPSHLDCCNTSNNGSCSPSSRRRPRRWAAVERESDFEIDRDKARDALEKLDQQLRALSEKEAAPPKRRPLSSSSSSAYSDSRPDKNQMFGMRAEEPEISGSYLAYSAVALLILTIVNNILFNVFIKPAVDGEEPIPAVERKSPSDVTVVGQAPLLEKR